MSTYHFNEIEAKWQKHWADNGTFHASNESQKPKYYVLDMFPYPSGAGLHVGHPLGYIAVMYMLDTNDIKGLMYYTPRAMILLDCPQSSMLFKQDSIQRRPHK